jgi:hypothetical protein
MCTKRSLHYQCLLIVVVNASLHVTVILPGYSICRHTADCMRRMVRSAHKILQGVNEIRKLCRRMNA